MKFRKLRLLAVFGLLALALLGVLLPKHTDASAPVQVDVVNKPTVHVGNTPNVNVTNTPSVSVSNTPNVNVANQVAIASLPDIQIAGGSVNATVAAPVYTYADVYPIYVNGQCGYPGCSQVNFYTVPDGYNAVISDFNGQCGVTYGSTSYVQLTGYWGSVLQAYNTTVFPVNYAVLTPGGEAAALTLAFGWNVTGAHFHAATGTSLSVYVNGSDTGDYCVYGIAGYLVPTSVSSPNLGVRAAPRRK